MNWWTRALLIWWTRGFKNWWTRGSYELVDTGASYLVDTSQHRSFIVFRTTCNYLRISEWRMCISSFMFVSAAGFVRGFVSLKVFGGFVGGF